MGRSGLHVLSTHIRSLKQGDACIAGFLALVFAILFFFGLYTLERQFLVEVPGRGGSLTEGVVGNPRFVHPLLAISDADRDLTSLTYAGLMGYDARGALIPVLAERYEVSEDKTTYTFYLREDAKFSDGTPVTADDVVYTVEKAQDPALKSPRLNDFANIRVETVDAATVRFTLPSAYAPFLEETTLGILPARLWRGVTNEQFPFSPMVERPVGAGAFVPSEITRDKDGFITRYRLSANDSYALGRPYLDSVTFHYFKDARALSDAFRSGKVESVYGIPSEDAYRIPYTRVFGVFWNAAVNPVFARSEVREALSTALNRDALVRDVLGGYGVPAYGPVPPKEAITDPIADRLMEARTILEDGGWTYTEGEGWTSDAGTLAVTLSTSNVPELKAIAEGVRKDWNALGVPVSLELHDPSDLLANVIRTRDYSALLFGMVVGRDDDLYGFWHSSQRSDPGLNVALYTREGADDLLESLREEEDPAVRDGMLMELNTMIAEDTPAAFTHAPVFAYTLPKSIKGFAQAEVATPVDRLAGIHEWYIRSQAVWPFLVGL